MNDRMVKYKIKSERTRFWTGKTPGFQVMLGGVSPEIRAYFFSNDNDGVFRHVKHFLIGDMVEGSASKVEDQYDLIPTAVKAVIHELKMTAGVIQIEEYSDEYFSVSLLTDELQSFVETRNSLSTEEVEELEEAYEDWVASGYYALRWVEEYWMTADGELEVS